MRWMRAPTSYVAALLLLALPVLAQGASGEGEELAKSDDSAAEAQGATPLPPPAEPIDPATPVSEILWQLGDERPRHWIEPTDQRIRQGREIVQQGRTTTDDGKRSRRASPGYLCTDCHQLIREDPDLRVADPDARLDYAVANDMTFLPGTTLWGVVNRTSWFNEDYARKYGSLVEPTHHSLREATRLCAAECSQGRPLEDWELDAILAYLWTIQITLGDLDLSTQELDLLARAVGDESLHEQGRASLRSGYLQYAPAHLRDAPADRAAGYGLTGDPARGAELFRRSCLTCHDRNETPVRGSAPFHDSKASIGRLWANRAGQGKASFYQTVTYGTRPFAVPIVYMPFFTKERLSDQQMDDLRAWFAQVLGKTGDDR